MHTHNCRQPCVSHGMPAYQSMHSAPYFAIVPSFPFKSCRQCFAVYSGLIFHSWLDIGENPVQQCTGISIHIWQLPIFRMKSDRQLRPTECCVVVSDSISSPLGFAKGMVRYARGGVSEGGRPRALTSLRFHPLQGTQRCGGLRPGWQSCSSAAIHPTTRA